MFSLLKYKKCKFNLKRFRNSRTKRGRYAYGLRLFSAATAKTNPEINPNCRKLLALSFFVRLGCICFYKCQTLFFDLL